MDANRDKKMSAVLNTYNAELHLETVLKALLGFDEIVVCDMESTDRSFVPQGGFRDGKRGLVKGLMSSVYQIITLTKLAERSIYR